MILALETATREKQQDRAGGTQLKVNHPSLPTGTKAPYKERFGSIHELIKSGTPINYYGQSDDKLLHQLLQLRRHRLGCYF